MTLEAIRYSKGSLSCLDQLQLPHRIHYDDIRNSEDAWHAIKEMRVRGAPAIAMLGILGLAVEIANDLRHKSMGSGDALRIVAEKLDYIVTSRPTAVNLRNMAEDFKNLTKKAVEGSPNEVDAVWTTYLAAAKETLITDVRENQRLGDHGAAWLLENSAFDHRGGISVITHCNTGSLATAGYGTALGVIRSLHCQDALHRAYCTETRPYNQGSRLTAFELVHDKIPATLITDSMAGALLKLRKDSEKIAGIVVGADRIAANGDTANKIGTYSLAVSARHHRVKFLVAAPCSTIDLETRNGDDITIEERPSGELTTISGPLLAGTEMQLDKPAHRVSIAAAGIDVWNPAFDVTPAALIDAIITEKGTVERGSDSHFDLVRFMKR